MGETYLERSSARWDNVILSVRGRKVIIDADLARLYGVTTAALNQAVRRNAGRFPEDFAFRLTPAERSEVITNCDHLKKIKYSRMLPLVFTEHDAELEAIVREIKNLNLDSKPTAKRIGFRRSGDDD